MATLARQMADFTFSLRYEDIPPNVIQAARRYLADALACSLGAYRAETVEGVRQHALQVGGSDDATLLGTDIRVPSSMAALVNGTMVRYLDANDISALRAGGHFSDGTPALIAIAEKHQRSGKELLTCLVASYELQGALAESFDFMSRGFHALAQVPWTGPIVATRLSEGTPEEAVHASGLSGTTGMVMNTWLKPSERIPSIKSVAVGMASQRAVEAANLAAVGVTAPDDALETALFRLESLADLPVRKEPFAQLGHRWTSLRNIIKAYPAQIYTQAAVEAAVALHRKGVRAQHVRKLILYGHRNVASGVQGSREAFTPRSREAADHSTPYVMAMALMRGKLTLREYDGAPWETDEVRDIMSRIELVVDPERDRAMAEDGILGVRLVADLEDGSTEAIEVHQPKGHPDAPFDDAGLLDKMTWLLEDVVAPDIPSRLMSLCERLSSPEDVTELIEACRV